jgi:hypothetical protein
MNPQVIIRDGAEAENRTCDFACDDRPLALSLQLRK